MGKWYLDTRPDKRNPLITDESTLLHSWTNNSIIHLKIDGGFTSCYTVCIYLAECIVGRPPAGKNPDFFFFLRQANFIISSSNLFCYLNNVNIVESHILKNKFSPWRPEYFTSMWTETCLMGSLLHSILEQGWMLAFLIP